MDPRMHNIGAYISAADCDIVFAAVAGDGTVDSVAQTGAIIDRLAFGDPLSLSVLIPWVATMASGHTFSLAWTLQHGDAAALGDVATFASAVSAVVGTGPANGAAVHGVLKADVDLAGAKRYLRLVVTSDLSAANTDVSNAAALLVLGGEGGVPAV